MSIRRILIANRGEIAMRVIRAARSRGIETVLAASEADRDGLPARYADRTVCIGPARASDSYLRIDTIVAAALGCGADAVHPGYGFLSENAAFAEACETAGIVFIGPTPEHVRAIGDKLRARAVAVAAHVPVNPGGPVDSLDGARRLADHIGYPVLVKAVGGGGGRGLKRVNDPAQLAESLTLAVAEAQAAFGDARVYLERFVSRGRHIEVQVLGDGDNVIHLGERDCSVQRRYQKVLEEACAVDLPEDVRDEMHTSAVRFARSLRYRGAGTVEFLYDAERRDFSFLEMNARIQVEHPVTEAVTGVDLVDAQIAIAEGAPIEIEQAAMAFDGHAIECRINAEDPDNGFRPNAGTITTAVFPAGPGIRVDTFVESGARVSPFYDSLIAKIIVHASDRRACIERLRGALRACRIDGVATNLSLHERIVADPTFLAGAVTTSYLEEGVPSRR